MAPKREQQLIFEKDKWYFIGKRLLLYVTNDPHFVRVE